MKTFSALSWIVFSYSIYSLLLEFAKVRRRGLGVYLSDWITLFDILNVISMFLFSWLSLTYKLCPRPLFWAVCSITSPVLWWKLLNYLRANPTLDWILAITGEIMKTAIPFLILLAFIILSASEAFFAHS